MKAIATLEIERVSLVSDGVDILGAWLRVVSRELSIPLLWVITRTALTRVRVQKLDTFCPGKP